jgi:O-antigen/teichoic acid export membrane protein
MRQSTRLILNTGATYVRMAVTVGMGLVATRLAYQELGKTNFDLWALLTMTVMGLVFLAEACYGSAERSMALAIGAKDDRQLRRVFTNSTAMQMVIAAGFLVVGMAVGRFGLRWIGVAPEELSRATIAFDLIVGAIALWIASQTFRSMFVAHQSLVWLTLADLLDAGLRLGAIAATIALPGDRLVIYCLMLLLAQAGVTTLLVVLCWRCYRTAWPRVSDLDRATARGLFNFGAWALLGNLSYRVRTSGPPLVLGRAFGTAYNGAYNQAYQVAGYQVSLASAIMRAAQPALNAAHGRGDRTTVEQLAHLVNKYSVLLALFYIVPIVIEAPVLLQLWLTDPPPMSDTFVRLALVTLCVPWLTMGHHLAILGHGGIRRYMTLSLLLESAAVAMGAVAVLWQGLPAWTVLAYAFTGQCWTACLVLHAAWRSQGIRFRSWIVHSILPIAMVAVPSTAAAFAVHEVMSPGLARVITVGAVYGLLATPLTWALGMRGHEREHFLRIGRGVSGKVAGAVRRRSGGTGAGGSGQAGGPNPSGGAAPADGTVGPSGDAHSLAAAGGTGVR